MDTSDSLAFDPENPEEFIVDCPWMQMVTKNTGFITEFERPIQSRNIDFDLDESEGSIFQYQLDPPGDDFIKKCNFKYLPGKMFNLQVVYE